MFCIITNGIVIVLYYVVDLYRYPEVSEDLTGHMSGVRDGEFRVWKYLER